MWDPSEYHEAKLPGERLLKSTDSMVTEPVILCPAHFLINRYKSKAFNRTHPLPHSSQRWKTITKVIYYFIAKGIHPFQEAVWILPTATVIRSEIRTAR